MTVVEKKISKNIQRYNITDIFSCKYNCGLTHCHNDVYIHENQKFFSSVKTKRYH